MITNVGTDPITLPASVDQNMERTDVLTLWLTSDAITSDAIKDAYLIDQGTGRLVKIEAIGTSAELYGRSGDPRTFHVLIPNETIRVRASSRVSLNPGIASLTGHAELLRVLQGRSDLMGNSDAEPVTNRFYALPPNKRRWTNARGSRHGTMKVQSGLRFPKLVRPQIPCK